MSCLHYQIQFFIFIFFFKRPLYNMCVNKMARNFNNLSIIVWKNKKKVQLFFKFLFQFTEKEIIIIIRMLLRCTLTLPRTGHPLFFFLMKHPLTHGCKILFKNQMNNNIIIIILLLSGMIHHLARHKLEDRHFHKGCTTHFYRGKKFLRLFQFINNNLN